MSYTDATGVGGTTISSGTLANRPTAGVADHYYWATDVYMLFRDTGIVWEVVGAQPYARYYAPPTPYVISAPVVVSANRLVYTPIIVPFTCTVDGVIKYNHSVNAGNYYSALYDSLNESPVNRLAISNQIPTNGVSQKQFLAFTSSLQITSGYYFVACVDDTALDNHGALVAVNAYGLPANMNNGPQLFFENIAVPPVTATPTNSTLATHTMWLSLRVASIP